MLDKILGFFWWPYAWSLRLQEINARERDGFAKWYKDIYVPSLKRESERQLAEYKRPSLIAKFTKENP